MIEVRQVLVLRPVCAGIGRLGLLVARRVLLEVRVPLEQPPDRLHERVVCHRPCETSLKSSVLPFSIIMVPSVAFVHTFFCEYETALMPRVLSSLMFALACVLL